MPHQNNDDWERWRGSTDMQMKAHAVKIEEHCERLAQVEEKVGAILVKLAVPIFLTSLIGVGIGGVIVALLTKALR